MEKSQIMYLLLSILLFENYFIFKKYRSIFLNLLTFFYLVVLPFYCFISTPYKEIFDTLSLIVLILVMGLSVYYSIKLAFGNKDKKYHFCGFGFSVFGILYIVVVQLMK